MFAEAYSRRLIEAGITRFFSHLDKRGMVQERCSSKLESQEPQTAEKLWSELWEPEPFFISTS